MAKIIMKIPILMCFLLSVGFASNDVISSVTVTVEEKQYNFAHEPRLVEVLSPIVNQNNWYWPSASLYEEDDKNLEKIRESLLDHLSILSRSYSSTEPEISKSLQHLQTIISSWRLARRLSIKIDYDLARIVTSANPLLPHGKYILKLTPRLNSVQLFGAIHGERSLKHQAYTNVGDYIIEQYPTDLADKNLVIIIQADGRKIIAPIAYWNKTSQEVMPSSQIFVPFKQSLLKPEFAAINRQIITLALNRVQ
jgi:hypothetical protein